MEKEEKRQKQVDEKRCVATVGTFDGLHRGHQRVLATLKSVARERGMVPLVVCFDRHPLETIAPERAPLLVQSPSERTNALYREGLSILTLEFTPELAALTAADWLRRMHEEHNVDVLVVGYDNTFGSDGVRMNLSDYRRIGAEIGVEVMEAPYEPRAASSAIRRLLREGDIEEANRLLGRPFTVTGTVADGKHLGTTLGYPTANVEASYRAQLPRSGVYAVDVVGAGGVRRAVANVGRQPTVAVDAPERLEVHIPGFSGNLYGERLEVRFLRRLRDEIKFPSLADLKEQIEFDISEALSS